MTPGSADVRGVGSERRDTVPTWRHRQASGIATDRHPASPRQASDITTDRHPASPSAGPFRTATGPTAGCGSCLTWTRTAGAGRSEEHTSELQSRGQLVCRLLLEKKKKAIKELSEEIRMRYTNKEDR